MAIAASIADFFQTDGLVDHRTDAVTNVTPQAQKIETVLFVNQNRHAHLGLVDVGELGVQGAGWASLDAGNFLAHFARNLARFEIGRANRHAAGPIAGEGVTPAAELEVLRRTVAHAQAAAQASTQKSFLNQCARWAQGLCRARHTGQG